MVSCGSPKMRLIAHTGPIPSIVTIYQGKGMGWFQMVTLIIFIWVLSRDVLDLGILFSEVYWVIVKMLFLATPSRLHDVIICQGWDMSWWKWSSFIICVGFLKIYGSELEGLVLDVDLVISKSPSSSTSFSGE